MCNSPSVAAAALTAQEKAVNTELLAVGREQLQRIADAAKGRCVERVGGCRCRGLSRASDICPSCRDVGAVLAVACDVL